jgi:hypothetical protein
MIYIIFYRNTLLIFSLLIRELNVSLQTFLRAVERKGSYKNTINNLLCVFV